MKKSFWIVLATVLVALVSAGCAKEFDDSEIWGKISEIDQRLSALEQTVKTLNEKTIPGLQTIIEALLAKDPVVSVTRTDEGALITFYSGKTAVVPIDKGDPGESPVMGVKIVDGVYCWTVNGELIKDADGKPVPVNGKDGANPSFRTENGKLEYSIDGENWVDVPEVGTPAAVVTVDETDDSVIVTSGSTTIVLSKELPFSIQFVLPQETSIMKGETIYVGYTLEGVKADDVTEVGILTATAGFEAEVEPYAGQNDAGVISITNNDEAANLAHKVYVFAANGKGKTDIKGLSFSSSTLKAILNVQVAPAADGSVVELNVKADEDYDISVSDDASWIHVTPPTRALFNDKLSVTVDENATNSYRSGTISLLSKVDGSVLDEVDLLQAPSSAQTTSIASLDIIPDGTAISLYKVSAVAASSKRAIITDGVSRMYVVASGVAAGSVYNFAGVKKTDEAGLAYLETSSSEVDSAEEAIILAPKDYYEVFMGLDNDYNYIFSAMNGSLSRSGSKYIVTSLDESVQFVLADAPSSLGLSSLVGKYVTIKAWVISTEGDYYNSAADVIAVDVKELTFVEEAGWAIDFDGESLVSVTSTLADNYYTFSIFDKDEVDAEFSQSEFIFEGSYYLQDDILFSSYLYSLIYEYPFAEMFEYFASSGDDTADFDMDYGKYYVLVTGLDEFGVMTGQYALKEIEKVDPHVPAAYEDFIGEWEVGSQVWKISAKESGASYSIEGACIGSFASLDIIARFEEGKLVLPEQVFDVAISTEYGTLSPVYFTGSFTYYGDRYAGFGYLDEEPGVIMTIGKLGDGSFDITPGYSPFAESQNVNGEYTNFGVFGEFIDGENKGYIYFPQLVTMPTYFTKNVPVTYVFKEDFEDESTLANWSFFDADGDGYNWDWDGELTARSGSGIIYSQSYINNIGPLNPDNWAFTPQITFTSDNYVNLWVVGQDASYSKEHYGIYIIADAPTADNLTSATLLTEGNSSANYQKVSVKVPDSYANKTGYIGIRHFNCTDMYFLNVDDLAVVEGAAPAAAPAKSALKHRHFTEKKFKIVKRGTPVSKASLETNLPARRCVKSSSYKIR